MSDPTHTPPADAQPKARTDFVDPSIHPETRTAMPRHMMNAAQRAAADSSHVQELEAAKEHLPDDLRNEIETGMAANAAESKNRAAIDRVRAATSQPAEAAPQESRTE
jgi:hypothetical protein